MRAAGGDNCRSRLTTRELESILDGVVEGVVTLDERQRVIGINRAACEMLEIDAQQAVESTCETLLGSRFCGGAVRIREAVEQQRAVEDVLLRFATVDGRRKVLSFRVDVLRNEQGAPRGSIVVFRDVTELISLKADLARHFVDRFRKKTGRPIEGISEEAMTVLLDHPWSGKVRALENVIEYAFVKARTGKIMPEHLPAELGRPSGSSGATMRPYPAMPFAMPLGQAELSAQGGPREVLIRTLQTTGWNVAKAARRLNVSRTTLYVRIARFGLKRPKE